MVFHSARQRKKVMSMYGTESGKKRHFKNKNSDGINSEHESEIITKKDIIDVRGMTIPKGTPLYILKEVKINNSRTGKTERWRTVKVDNGTGIKSTMTETAYKENVSGDAYE